MKGFQVIEDVEKIVFPVEQSSVITVEFAAQRQVRRQPVDAFFQAHPLLFEIPDDLANGALQADHVVLVEGLLQRSDQTVITVRTGQIDCHPACVTAIDWGVRGDAVSGVFEIVDFDVADHAFAGIENFEGVLNREVAEIEREPGTGVQGLQAADQLVRRETEQLRRVIVCSRLRRIVHAGIAAGGQVLLDDGVDVQGREPVAALAKEIGPIAACGRHLGLQPLPFAVGRRSDRPGNEAGQMQQ